MQNNSQRRCSPTEIQLGMFPLTFITSTASVFILCFSVHFIDFSVHCDSSSFPLICLNINFFCFSAHFSDVPSFSSAHTVQRPLQQSKLLFHKTYLQLHSNTVFNVRHTTFSDIFSKVFFLGQDREGLTFGSHYVLGIGIKYHSAT